MADIIESERKAANVGGGEQRIVGQHNKVHSRGVLGMILDKSYESSGQVKT
jgi:hypothetical protein